MNLARVAWDENNLSRAHELLEKHRPQPGETDLRGFEWHYLRRLLQSDLLTVKAHAGEVMAVAFTPDGKRLVTSGSSRPWLTLSDPRPGDVKLWDAATGQPLRVQLSGPADKVDRAALSPDGTHLAATRVGIRRSWSGTWPRAGSSRWKGPRSRPPAVWLSVPTASDWPARTAPLTTIRSRTRQFDPDLGPGHAPGRRDHRSAPRTGWGRRLQPGRQALGRRRPAMGLVKVWDAATGREAFSCDFTDGGIVWDAAFSPDGKRLAACADKGIRIWDVASRATQATWPSDSKASQGLAFSPDGNRLATGGLEGMVELWDTATGQKVQIFKGHFGAVHRDGLQSGRHAAGHGGLRRHPAPLGRDLAAGLPFPSPKTGSHARELPELSPDGRDALDGLRIGPAKAPPALEHRDGPAALRPDRASPGRGQPAPGPPTGDICTSRTPARPCASWTSRPARWSARSRSMPRPSPPASPSVPMRDGAPTAGPVARSRCGRPGPEPSSARSGISTGPTRAPGVQSGRLAPDGSRSGTGRSRSGTSPPGARSRRQR